MNLQKTINSNYQNLVKKILDTGYLYDDPNRKGVKRLEIPSYTFRHEFKDGFPAITLKKLAWKSVVTEALWFLKGNTNIKYLIDNGCNIWNKDAYNYYLKHYKIFSEEPTSFKDFISNIKDPYFKPENFTTKDYTLGGLGKVYGYFWRNFDGVDQIAELIRDMINKPMSSELIVSARNPSHKEEQALPCCHYSWQVIMRPLTPLECGEYGTVSEKHNGIRHSGYGFELHFQMRSVDTFLGLPFNIASYALLALILEKITGHKALGIQGDLKKVHLYDNSIEAAKELITRKCSEEKVICNILDRYEYERLGKERCSLDNLLENIQISDFTLENYNPQPAIKVEMLERR